jgi:t-SNARE complex subunit (syntaxin)
MNYEATNDLADAKDLQADAKRMEALMQSLDGLLDMAMQHMKQHMAQWDNVLDAIVGAMNDRNQSVMRAKLGI